MTRVAFITVADGPHTGNYLSTLPLMDGIDEVAVCDLQGGALFDRARDVLGERMGKTYTDVAACLADGPYLFALISLDNQAVVPAIRASLEAGLHVFTEKTGGRSYAEFAPQERYAREHGLHIGMAYLNRFRPSVLDARKVIADGAIGRLYGFYVQSIATHARGRSPETNWTFSKELAGGGYLIWLGCHYLDLLRYVTSSEVTRVAAMTGVVSGLPLEVEDAAGMTLQLDDGAIGTANFGYYLDSGKPHGGKQSAITVWGELGWVRMYPGEDNELPLEIYSTHPDYSAVPYRSVSYGHRTVGKAYGSALGLDFMNMFVDACRGTSSPPIDAGDAGAVLRILDATYESAATGRHVEIAPPA